MASHDQKLDWYGDLICGKDMVSTTFFGRGPVRTIPEALDAVQAVESALYATGYNRSGGPIGSYACRTIGGSNKYSLHSVPIALDVEYDVNPHLHTPIPRGFGVDSRFRLREVDIDAIEAIVNTEGTMIWKWLGWSIGDTMHIEIDVPRDKLELGDTMKWSDIVADETWTKAYEDGFIAGDPAVMPQYYWAGGPATEDEKKNAYNVIMQNQMEATK